MDILQDIAQMNTKVHNGFAGLMTRTHASVVTETKETTERTLEVAEKTLAAVRVFRPLTLGGGALGSRGRHPEVAQGHPVGYGDFGESSGVAEDLGQRAHARDAASGHMPPGHVPAASSHSVPPPPQHAPNLLNLTPAGNSGPGGGWGANGPTAAVMLGHPQQILRMMAGHAGDGSN